MQIFQNTADQTIWQFNPDVLVTDTNGVFSFKTAFGVPLVVPTTLVPFTIPTPTPAQLLAAVQVSQSSIVKTSCANAITTTFSSSALGSAFNYDCAPLDQVNISYVSVHGGSLWCQAGMNPMDVYSPYNHTGVAGPSRYDNPYSGSTGNLRGTSYANKCCNYTRSRTSHCLADVDMVNYQQVMFGVKE